MDFARQETSSGQEIPATCFPIEVRSPVRRPIFYRCPFSREASDVATLFYPTLDCDSHAIPVVGFTTFSRQTRGIESA